jgi:hypothetical protein
MASSLKTTYKDDIFSGRRKYNMITNTDTTVSFEDVTNYSQQGDVFAAADVNAITTAINNINVQAQEALVVSSTEIPVSSRDAGKIYFFRS